MSTAIAGSGKGQEASRRSHGGVLLRAARFTSPYMLRTAGKRWNPIFSVVEHVGRRSGRRYTAPVAARRTSDGFVISLAFGSQVDWYRNLIAAGGGTIRWRERAYRIGPPTRIDRTEALATFHPLQRLFLRLAGIDGYLHVRDAR